MRWLIRLAKAAGILLIALLVLILAAVAASNTRWFREKIRTTAETQAARFLNGTLSLGAIETPALTPFLTDPKMRDGMIARTPMRRIGRVDDAALAALYLCSDASSYVTGKILEVDGGLEASNFPIDLPDL